MKKIIFISTILLIALLNIFILSQLTKKNYIDETLIEIKKNSNSLQIANLLFKNGIIKSPKMFYYYVRLYGYDKKLQAGTYLIKGNLNIPQIAKIILKGKVFLQKVTFPEGWTYKKIARRLYQKGLIDYKKFITLCTDSSYVKKVTTYSKNSIEGFLYPDTYYFPKGATERFIIKTMVSNFYKKTSDLNISPDFPLDFYQIIVMASIVERESGLKEEKPLIAGVYIRRLEKGYKLQADPTVAYILEQKGKSRKKLYYKDLLIDSPYNTYLYKGLPPTPIANPSLETIKAVLNYQPTDYMFFFANNGRHIFSKTYKAHLNKQNRVK